MEWQDQGIVLSCRKHGEKDAILEVMTLEHGRHFGVMRGVSSPQKAAMVQPGNHVSLLWRARLEEHIGYFTAENLHPRAGMLLNDGARLRALTYFVLLLRLLPEREPHHQVFHAAEAALNLLYAAVRTSILAIWLIRFEVLILAKLGFGLDLSCCALTDTEEDLAYVSPKTGRAVNRAAGAPWSKKLLPLPLFLAPNFVASPVFTSLEKAQGEEGDDPSSATPCDAPLTITQEDFKLTEYFLERHVFTPRGLDYGESRARLIADFLAATPPHQARKNQ